MRILLRIRDDTVIFMYIWVGSEKGYDKDIQTLLWRNMMYVVIHIF